MPGLRSSSSSATAIGCIAILLWSLLAMLTVGTAPVPPLQLNAMSFAIGGGLGLVWLTLRGELAQLRKVRWPVYAFGTLAFFGYHLLYFTALRLAPPAEASLVAFLWPLLIVLFSGLLPGERLTAAHVVGAAIAFGGAVVLIGGHLGSDNLTAQAMLGYALAFGCALTWSTYSLLSRRIGAVSSAAVAIYCLATAGFSALSHIAVERTVWPESAQGWFAILALGCGPVGLAFYVWDHGVKRGDIQILGTASYAAPLISTLALILAGQATADWRLGVAAAMVTGGAALAAWASAAGKAGISAAPDA